MKTNYYLAMTSQLSQVTTEDNLLLHCCCAPCLSGSLPQLLPYFSNITVYYSNDNITDPAEWDKRLQNVIKLVDIVSSRNYAGLQGYNCNIKLVVKPLEEQLFYDKCSSLANEREGGLRCHNCISMRLTDSYNYASSNNYSYYTSTLTISPHKDSQFINDCGLANQNDLTKWLCSDFKKKDGYKNSIALSNQHNIYRQNYCGCNYSKIDSNN